MAWDFKIFSLIPFDSIHKYILKTKLLGQLQGGFGSNMYLAGRKVQSTGPRWSSVACRRVAD